MKKEAGPLVVQGIYNIRDEMLASYMWNIW